MTLDARRTVATDRTARRIGRRTTALLALWAATLWATTGLGQADWDPERYVELTTTGQELYTEAIGNPDASVRQRALLQRASDDFKEALAMVRRAIDTGAIEQGYRAALQDFFTLMENLSVVWIALEECGPAQRLVEVALEHPDLEPSEEPLFRNLEPRLSACRERANAWSWERYDGLVDRADTWHTEAIAGAVVDQTALDQSVVASAEALRIYREALLAGELGTVSLADPVAELVTRYDETIDYQIDAGACADAAATEAESAAVFEGLLWTGRFELRSAARLPSCETEALAVAAAQAAEEEENGGASLRKAGGWALVGAAVVLGASGLVVNLTGADARDELDDLEAACEAESCDQSRIDNLDAWLDDRDVATFILLGTAGAAAVGGIVLVLIDGGEAPDELGGSDVSVAPRFYLGGGAGADVTFRF